MKDLIRKLVEAWGPSGYEHHIRKLIQDEVTDLADEITVDPLGNLICRVGGSGPKVMVGAANRYICGKMIAFPVATLATNSTYHGENYCINREFWLSFSLITRHSELGTFFCAALFYPPVQVRKRG